MSHRHYASDTMARTAYGRAVPGSTGQEVN